MFFKDTIEMQEGRKQRRGPSNSHVRVCTGSIGGNPRTLQNKTNKYTKQKNR